MGTMTIDAAVRSTAAPQTLIDTKVSTVPVQATNITSLCSEAQQEYAATFRCEHCHRRQFFREGQRKCRVCQENIPQGKMFRPAPLRLPFGHWLCKRLKSVRLQKGLSQRSLADLAPTPRTYISKYENLRCVPTLGILEKLARALGIELAELLDRDVPVHRLATAGGMLDAAGQASHEELMAQLTELLPQLTAGARETLLVAARGMVSGQRTFDDWFMVH